ncbi:hypothetical protein QU814_15675 [Providencia rettgeri]|uniref:hypothetical protein n=1 Tax=Providencia rettgeri TaxID=587 RepID=UPI000D7005A1|nr:hypothetical protein [Providencia rettgeri]MDM9284584.1 hypothetical protein [Providencia rettgeri]
MSDCVEGTIEKLLCDVYNEMFSKKKDHFLYFAEEGISFELWLTTELAMYFRNEKYNVDFTPGVVIKEEVVGVENQIKTKYSCRYLDLFVSNEIDQCAIELKIATPATQSKYNIACRNDITKLSNISKISTKAKIADYNKMKKLFVLVVVSKRNEVGYKANWNEWLDKIYEDSNEKAESLIKYSEFSEKDNEDLTAVVYHKFVK